MYRTNAQSRALEEAFIRATIPLPARRRHALLRAARGEGRARVPAAGPQPVRRRRASRASSTCRAAASARRRSSELERWARELGVPQYTALQMHRASRRRPRRAGDRGPRRSATPIGAAQAKTLVEFLAMLDELIERRVEEQPLDADGRLLEHTGYRRYLFDEFEEAEAEERWANVGELRNVAAGVRRPRARARARRRSSRTWR